MHKLPGENRCQTPGPRRPQQPRCAVQALRIDNSKRTEHGALVDSLLLAEVYIELLGVRQRERDPASWRGPPAGLLVHIRVRKLSDALDAGSSLVAATTQERLQSKATRFPGERCPGNMGEPKTSGGQQGDGARS